MSQAEFAQSLSALLGRRVTPSQVSDWERGRFPPSGELLLAAAEIAGGSLDALRESGGGVGQRLDQLEDEITGLHEHFGAWEGESTVAQELAGIRRDIGILQAQVLHLRDQEEPAVTGVDEETRSAQAR